MFQTKDINIFKKEIDIHKYLFTKRRDSRCFFKVCLKNRNFLFVTRKRGLLYLETEKMFMPTYRVTQNGMPN